MSRHGTEQLVGDQNGSEPQESNLESISTAERPKSTKRSKKKKKKKRKKKGDKMSASKQRAPSAITAVAANTQSMKHHRHQSVVRLRSTTSLSAESPPPMEPRKSVINMLRRGQVVEDLETPRQNEDAHELRAVEVVVRFRPINDVERAAEHRMLFRSEFGMENDDFSLFLAERQKLIDSFLTKNDVDGFKQMSVEAICEWLESIGLDSYKKRFRRRKVNGEWMHRFPRFHEKKPLEIEVRFKITKCVSTPKCFKSLSKHFEI